METDIPEEVKVKPDIHLSSCLFCGDEISQDFCQKEDYLTLPGSEGNFQVNQQLWSLFILRKLLGFPEQKIVELLKKTFGISLADWFGICQICLKIVEDAMQVYQRLVKLEEIFRSLGDEARQKINDTLTSKEWINPGGGRARDEVVVDVRTEIREHFRIEVAESTNHHAINEVEFLSDWREKDPDFVFVDEGTQDDFFEDENFDQNDKDDPLYTPSRSQNLQLVSSLKPTKRLRKNPIIRRLIPEDSDEPKPDSKSPKVDYKICINGEEKKCQLFYCNICVFKRLFISRSYFYQHMKRHRINKFPCPKCKFPCSSDSVLKNHLARNMCYPRGWKDEPNVVADVTCPAPEKVKPSFTKRSANIKERSNGGKVDKRVRSSEENRSEDRHFKVVHKNPNKKLPGLLRCNLCACIKYLRTKAAYDRHMKDHSLLQYPCPRCNFPCPTEEALKKHLKSIYCNRRPKNSKRFPGSQRESYLTLFQSNHQNERDIEDKQHKLVIEGDQSESETVIKEDKPTVTIKNSENHPEIVPDTDNIEMEQKQNQVDSNDNLTQDSIIGTTVASNDTTTGMVRCKLCRCMKYVKKAVYQRHLKHHEQYRYPCPKCNFPCSTEALLMKHATSIYCSVDLNRSRTQKSKEKLDLKIVKCLERRKKVLEKTVQAEPKSRRKKMNEEDYLKCKICSAKFTSLCKEKFELHMKRHQYFENCEKVDGKLKCKICSELLLNSLQLRRHIREKHSSHLGISFVYQCTMCDNNYSKKCGLEMHIAAVHTKKFTFFCEICGFGTVDNYRLKKHMDWFHNKEEEQFICEFCSATFKRKSTLQNHMRTVHKNGSRVNEEFHCKYCETKLCNKTLLNRHMKEAHKDQYVHECDQCENKYLSVASLQLHKKICHSGGNTEVECQFCQVKVRSQVYLYSHYQNSCKKKPPGFKLKIPRSK